MNGRVPDFFIVGHSKSGTTALYQMLRRHPEIYMPDLKEPRYFEGGLRQRSPLGRGPILPETPEEYTALFASAGSDRLAGEASATYLRSETAAKAIAEVNPDARCIAAFREPASFVRSLHLQRRKNHAEREKSLRKAIAAEEGVRDGKVVRRYSDHVRYVEQLRRFHAAFSAERVLTLIYEDFRRDNEATVRKILRFLEVDDTVPVTPLEANLTVEVRSLRLDSIVHTVLDGRGPVSSSLRRGAKAVLPGQLSGLPRGVRNRIVYTRPPPEDASLTAELRARYRPEVEALGDYLGRDLISFWGYDGS